MVTQDISKALATWGKRALVSCPLKLVLAGRHAAVLEGRDCGPKRVMSYCYHSVVTLFVHAIIERTVPLSYPALSLSPQWDCNVVRSLQKNPSPAKNKWPASAPRSNCRVFPPHLHTTSFETHETHCSTPSGDNPNLLSLLAGMTISGTMYFLSCGFKGFFSGDRWHRKRYAEK